MSLISQWPVPHAAKERLSVCSPGESKETRFPTGLVAKVALIEAGRGPAGFEIKGTNKLDRDETCREHLPFTAWPQETWS